MSHINPERLKEVLHEMSQAMCKFFNASEQTSKEVMTKIESVFEAPVDPGDTHEHNDTKG